MNTCTNIGIFGKCLIGYEISGKTVLRAWHLVTGEEITGATFSDIVPMFPLDFSNSELRKVEQQIVTRVDLPVLKKIYVDVGCDPHSIRWEQPMRYLVREALKWASIDGRGGAFVEECQKAMVPSETPP